MDVDERGVDDRVDGVNLARERRRMVSSAGRRARQVADSMSFVRAIRVRLGVMMRYDRTMIELYSIVGVWVDALFSFRVSAHVSLGDEFEESLLGSGAA